MIKDLLKYCFSRSTDMSSKNSQALMHTSLFSDLIKDITLYTSSGLLNALYHPGYKDTAIAQTLLLL